MAIMQRELNLSPVRYRRQPRRWDRAGAVGTITLLGLAAWLFYAVLSAVLAWASVKVDDVRYGYPRLYQTDAYIGYREEGGLPTHFLALNAHRQVLVLIVPGGDPGHVTVIKGPYLFGPGQEFSAVTLALRDTHHNGYPNLELHVAGQVITYLNDPLHKTFRLPHGATGALR